MRTGKRVKVPKYYDALVKSPDSYHWESNEDGSLKFVGSLKLTESELRSGARTRKARKHEHDNTPERLAVREEVQQQRISRLTRT